MPDQNPKQTSALWELRTERVVSPTPQDRFSIGDAIRPVARHIVPVAAIFSTVFGFVVGATLTRESIYASTSILLVKVGREFINPTEAGRVPVLRREEVINTEIEILQTRRVIESVVTSIGSTTLYPDLKSKGDSHDTAVSRFGFARAKPRAAPSNDELAVSRFSSALYIEPVPDAGVIRVTFQHPDPVMAAEAVNLLISYFMEQHLWAFGDARTTGFLKDKVAELERELEEADQKIRAFLEEHDEFISGGLEALVSRQKELTSDLNSAEAEIVAVQYQLTHLQTERSATSKYDAHDPHADLDQKILAASSRLAGLRAQEESIKERLQELGTKRAELPFLRTVYTNLEREASSTEVLLRTYSARLEEARVSEEMDREKIANIVVLQEGLVPNSPSGYRAGFILLVGGVIAAALAVIAAHLLDAGARGTDSSDAQTL